MREGSRVSARQGKDRRESRVYTTVNEHFEAIFNTVSRQPGDFSIRR